ncbi:Crp/Fnr family transcriptional regulator [Amycolatopsis sp. NPDC088138]|uniref:Crp/Fnr family transcriptional regulator n=1 Tax=Amycolatopsis sp. NPDC088138 TaxID=3363938 RepID=UPI0037F71826
MVADDSSVRIMDILDERLRGALEGLGSLVHFDAGQTIFWEGQPSRSVLIIREGHLKVTRHAADGTEVILGIFGPGEVMGDEGALMDEPRSAKVTTITAVIGLDISAEQLLDFVEQQHLWPLMYRAVVQRRRQMSQRVLLSNLDVKGRLADWLLHLAKEVGRETEQGWVLETTLSQQDLAARIGASRDAVAIELRRLRESKLVSTGRRRLVLHDLEALRRLSSEDRWSHR